jgi:hypothetical protein
VISKKGEAFHGADKDSVDAASIYVEELDDSASEDSSSSGSEGGNEKNKKFVTRTRVTTNSSWQERAVLQKRLGAEAYNPHDVSLTHIDASEIHEAIPRDHESY